MRYEREQVRFDRDDGFDVDGRVLAVLNATHRTAQVLVERPERLESVETTFTVGPAEDADEEPECGAPTANGTCTRTVDAPGERCWQHPEENDE